MRPKSCTRSWVALLVLGVSIVLETGSLVGCLREIAKLRRGRSLAHWVRKTRNAELVVVLGEDIAALLGLVIAFVFVSLAALTGDTRFDAAGSIAIGVGVDRDLGLHRHPDQAPAGGHLRGGGRCRKQSPTSFAATLRSHGLFNAITQQMGPQVMLAAKVRMRPGISIEAAVASINALERRIKERFPEVGWCFIEPDLED